MNLPDASQISECVRYLSGVASECRLVTYSECMSALGIANFNLLVAILSTVQQMHDDEIGCDLSALVISPNNGRPGRGWTRNAREDWDNAVARCYAKYSSDEYLKVDPQWYASNSPMSIHKLPYNPGNAGDLLKHGLLAVVVRWLMCRTHGVFKYADSFAGEWDYTLVEPVAARLKHLSGTLLARYSENHWRNGRYLGSTGLVSAIGTYEQRPVEIWIGDKCRDRVQLLVTEHGCHKLPDPADGYAILRSSQHYEFILLDPFADFLDQAPEQIPAIVSRTASSSILLFILVASHASDAYRRFAASLKSECRNCGAGAIVTRIPALSPSAVGGESGYDMEVVFIPQLDLFASAINEVLPQMTALAVRVAAALGETIEARSWMVQQGP